MLKKMISFIILTLILFSSFSISANAWSLNESEGDAEAYYLYNFENDLILEQKNADKIINAYSTVKMMAACVALESGISSDTVIIINEDMVNGVSGRFMGLREGDKMTFGDLLYSMINASFNDAAHAIALTVCDTIEAFIEKMNIKAKSLYMNSTEYFDITGLSSSSKTTVSDTVKLVKYLSKNETYKSITSTRTYQLSPFATCEYNKITNRSTLFTSYKGISNFNTGSSLDNEDTAVVCLNTDNLNFLCVVMNAKCDEDYNLAEKYVNRMLYHAIYDYSNKTVIKANKVIASLPVKYSISDDEIDVIIANDIKAYISTDMDIGEGIVYNYYLYDNELKAPLKAGDEVGVITVSQNGKFITSSKLTIKENVERNAFLYVMDMMKNFISSKAFIFSFIFFVILMVLYYLLKTDSINKMYNPGPRKTLKYYRK